MSETKVKGGGEQNLTVALRIRPMNEDEILMSATQIAYKVQKKMVVLMDPMEDPEDVLRANRSREKQFVFDYTFDGGASQEEVYRSTSQFLIPSVISGYNATVFAYGATGAGKTYTMLGAHDEPGIMAQALNDLFLEMDRTSDDMAYKVSMSYLEIYNEMIRDLLNPSAGILDLREDAKGGVQVAGLSEVTARSTDEVMVMLLKGNKERTQEPTAANKTSSRSHAVLQVSVKQQNRVRNTTQEVRLGRLFMIDLAGSERAANTHNKGKRMVEGAHINRSLLALGNCINALTDGKGSKYVNYRDSKLTRLLKDALGGNCKTVMIAHISPASIHFEESRNTLVYADRAKHIKTKVRRNVTDVSYHIAQYTNIIQELREEILRLRHRLDDKTSSPRNGVHIQAVQAEVMEAKREELNKLKEQLLISFKDQMELRKSLMELNNASMEVSLETNRNQLIISEWEVEKARISKRKEGGDTADSKALELSGAGSDEFPLTEDVKLAKEELKVLHEEKHRTEKLRATVQKELEQAKLKTRRLEETIPQRINTVDQREILSLLCKVHQLEIENTETQSACLLREFQIKRKDMVISRFRQHQNLCDQIIRRQRQIMEENKIAPSKDLEELYDLYKLERDDRMMLREDTGHLSPELRIKAPSMSSNYKSNLEADQLSALTEEDERGLLSFRSGDGDDKLFSKSARRMRDGAVTGAWRNDSNLSNGANNSNDLVSEDRHVIASNTRSIAALAAKKRSKAHNDLLNLERQFGGEPRTLQHSVSERTLSERDSYLTQNVLAKHDKNYGELTLPSLSKPPSEDNLDNISTGTKHSSNTDSTLPPIKNEPIQRRGLGDMKKNRRTRGYDIGYTPGLQSTRRAHSLGENGKSGKVTSAIPKDDSVISYNKNDVPGHSAGARPKTVIMNKKLSKSVDVLTEVKSSDKGTTEVRSDTHTVRKLQKKSNTASVKGKLPHIQNQVQRGLEKGTKNTEPSDPGSSIMKTGMNVPEAKIKRDQTFISNSSNLSKGKSESKVQEKGLVPEKKGSKVGGSGGISKRGSTIRYKDRKQAPIKYGGKPKGGNKAFTNSLNNKRNTVDVEQGSQGTEKQSAASDSKSIDCIPINDPLLGVARSDSQSTVIYDDPVPSERLNFGPEVNYEILPSRENSLNRETDEGICIGEEAEDVNKKSHSIGTKEATGNQQGDGKNQQKVKSSLVKREPVGKKSLLTQNNRNILPNKAKVDHVSKTKEVISKDSAHPSLNVILLPTQQQVSCDIEAESTLTLTMTLDDSTMSTNVEGHHVNDTTDNSVTIGNDTDFSEVEQQQNYAVKKKTADVKGKKSTIKKTRPYFSKVNHSKHTPDKVKRADSFLKIEGRPPTGARPKSLRSRLNNNVMNSTHLTSDEVPKSAEANLGEGREWTPPNSNKRGAKPKRYIPKGTTDKSGTPNSKKKVPTIPSYRKGDITVMGFSLPR